MKFQSKAQTLRQLRDQNLLFRIPQFLTFKALDFVCNETQVLDEVQSCFNNSKIIIRSSSHLEDGEFTSNAGKFLSILDVDGSARESIKKAIDQVLGSYANSPKYQDVDEFIVQLMIEKTSASGVIFTHDLNTGAPYYVINYDDISGLTNTVTSGEGNFSNKLLLVHRSKSQLVRSSRFQALLLATRDLEKKIGSNFLDIEFGLDESGKPYLFQVRQITTKTNWNRVVTNKVDDALASIHEFLVPKFSQVNHLFGRQSVFGQMPDWNPVELLGKHPKALSYSLYEKLVTDTSWSKARHAMGYGCKISQPLMVSLAGQPYIDVRLSFNSFLPPNIKNETCEKIINAWIDRLISNPELHDKIEFDVAITNYCFDIDARIARQIGDAINSEEKLLFKSELRKLTNKFILKNEDYSIEHLFNKIEILKGVQVTYGSSIDIADLHSMIDACIEFGVVPFAMLARHGFVARSILESFVKIGILSEAELLSFYTSFKTVAGDFVAEMNRSLGDENLQELFLKKYGHLRPGTYNILSKRYDQMIDLDFNIPSNNNLLHENNLFHLSEDQINEIDSTFQMHEFEGIDPLRFFEYARKAIQGREYAKFVFTKSISEMLELIARYGEGLGLNREELSHIEVDAFLKITTKSNAIDLESHLRKISYENQDSHRLSQLIKLPQILHDFAGVHVIPYQTSQPNFITQKQISAELIRIGYEFDSQLRLDGKIVLIENADPGYDWLFSRKISGLITKYGGVNSHMAIRCAEFGLPAAIGCGEQRYDQLLQCSRVQLDCSAGTLNPVH